MIHVMLPMQYLPKAGERQIEPQKRLMLAVLQTVIDDCQGSQTRQAAGLPPAVDGHASRYACPSTAGGRPAAWRVCDPWQSSITVCSTASMRRFWGSICRSPAFGRYCIGNITWIMVPRSYFAA